MGQHLEYELRARSHSRQRGEDPIASVLFHAGRCHFVTHGSRAEHDLLDEGAVHVAMLRFDPHPPRQNPVTVAARGTGGLVHALAWGSTAS